jgi:excisionase family DNA binding protein
VSKDTQERELYSVAQAAAYCGVHPNTIRAHMTSGKLPALRLGARIIRIEKAALDVLLTPYVGGEYGVWSR